MVSGVSISVATMKLEALDLMAKETRVSIKEEMERQKLDPKQQLELERQKLELKQQLELEKQ
jgi:hypothetical protein